MFHVGPTFFSSPLSGDHVAGDGLTRFQTMFEAASPADISDYLIGSGAQDGGTLSDGMYAVSLDGVSTNNRYIIWSNANFLPVGVASAMTCEWFCTLREVAVNPAASTKWNQMTMGGVALDFYVNGLVGAVNALRIDLTGTGTIYTGSADAWGTNIHFAVVWRATGYMDIYVNGDRVVTSQAYSYLGETGSFQLGGVSTNFANRFEVDYFGGRARRAEMYSGASFTPPDSTDDWGLP